MRVESTSVFLFPLVPPRNSFRYIGSRSPWEYHCTCFTNPRCSFNFRLIGSLRYVTVEACAMCRKIEFRVFVRKPATIDSSCRSIEKYFVRAYHWIDRKERLINRFSSWKNTPNVYIVRIVLYTSVFFIYMKKRFRRVPGLRWKWNERNDEKEVLFRFGGIVHIAV